MVWEDLETEVIVKIPGEIFILKTAQVRNE